MNALALFKKRRTQYALGKNISLNQEQVDALIKDAIKQSPSAFNSQSSRAVILFGDQSQRLWEIVTETLRAIVPADQFAPTEDKMRGFAAGVGTVLFFEDQAVVKKLQQDFPLYADKFPEFSSHSAGMAQLAVWTALADANIGASLQHYNPLIDEAVRKEWNLPDSWYLSAQMPFGSNEQGFEGKDYMDDAERFRTFS